ncbi:MAG TPA: PQQ-dependent sugar dehydrogenase [Pyrinomonadaceae bacterium]|jgi:glucose/arabinose dehydrogenase|nr:PQQ-dependent sugar dehydrogenase [Pyrinomonadaceae bacterium]
MKVAVVIILVCASVCAVTLSAAGVANASTGGLKLVPNRIALANGKSFVLNLPEGFAIKVAAEGLKRVRFMAKSPDGRIFLTDMYNLADNTRGTVYILDHFNADSGSFQKVTTYLKDLRNPNSIAFYTDQEGVDWFYLALTDHLLRYKYIPGEDAPSAKPEVLAKFPDYGLSYKYGGWHLTRTIAIGDNGKIYISVGSSCNACEEKEEVRASILEMDPDGKNQKFFARGLRNAVGLRWIQGQLLATNMGSDHLGDHKPADTMYLIKDGTNYGWPYCYQYGATRAADPKFNLLGKKMNCSKVPLAFAAFDAHSSPLGFEFFDSADMGPVPKSGYGGPLRDSYLVALHGSTKKSLNRGYRVVRLQAGRKPTDAPEDFINGFLAAGKVNGRPVDVLSFGIDGFLLTDDNAGVVYYVYEK